MNELELLLEEYENSKSVGASLELKQLLRKIVKELKKS